MPPTDSLTPQTLTPIYNGVGDRVGQTVESTTTDFALDIAAGLPEVIYTSQSEVYLHLPGVIVTEKASEVRYLLSDGLGSIRQATDDGGAVIAYNEFDPYGNPIVNRQSEIENPYGFTGEWWEDDVSLLHLRARWYTPETGTFLSRDPVESEPAYQYVRGNVVNLVDPSGLCAAGTCGPDMTEWLMEEMRRHVNYGLDIKSLRNSMVWQVVTLEAYGPKLGTIRTETPFTEIIDSGLFDLNNRGGTTAVDAMGILEYALYGLAVDYTNVNFYNFERDGFGTCGNQRCLFRVPKPGGEGTDDHRSMTLCGKCIDASDIGNMMFGAGGNGRGYNLAFVFGSAQLFNILNDVIEPSSRGQFDQISNPFTVDPKGAIAGWFLAQSTAYVSQNQFCSVLENWDWINYRDNASIAATCPACETDRLKSGSGHTIGPGKPNRSLFAVSDDRLVINELKDRLD